MTRMTLITQPFRNINNFTENFNSLVFHIKLKSLKRVFKEKDTLSVAGASFKSDRNKRTGALRRFTDSVLDESCDVLSVSKGLGSFLVTFNRRIEAGF